MTDRCWRAFVEQWPALRSGNGVAREQAPSADTRTYRRRDLQPDRCINLDSDKGARDTILRLLAHDFSPGYTAQIEAGGKTYNVTLNIASAATEEKH